MIGGAADPVVGAISKAAAGLRRLCVASLFTAVLGIIVVYGATRLNGRLAEAKVWTESMTQLHAASAHFPIGLLISSAFFDLAGARFRREDLKSSAFWTHLLGTLGAAGTVVIGFLGNPFACDTGEMAAKVLLHQRVGVATAIVFGLLALWRVLRQNRFSRVERVLYALATLLGVCVVSATGYLGGHMME